MDVTFMGFVGDRINLAWIVVFVCEPIAAHFWPRWYAQYGIPVYWSSKKLSTGDAALPSVDALQKHSEISPRKVFPIKFLALPDGAIAFRVQFRAFYGYLVTPMRGLVRIEQSDNSVRILGLLNWWFLIFVVDFIYGVFYPTPSPFFSNEDVPPIYPLIGFSAGVGCVYWIQMIRFKDTMEFITTRE